MLLNTWEVILVALFALLAGLAIPLIVQMRSTLRTIEKAVVRSEPSFHSALSKLELSADRVERMTRGLEGGEHQVTELIARLEEVNRILKRVSGVAWVATSVAAAIGPAVSAAMQSYTSGSPKEASKGRQEQSSNGHSGRAETSKRVNSSTQGEVR